MSETDLKSAEALIARGEHLEARAALARALSADPGNVHAQHLLSTIDMDEGQYDAARLKIEQLLEGHPDMAPAIYNLGVCLMQTQRFSDAATQFERTLVLDPTHSGAMYNIAWLLRRAGDLDDAAKKFAALVKHNPGWMSACEALIETHLSRSRAEDAVEVADEVIRRGTANARVYRLRGAALLQLGRVPEAEGNYRTALASNENDPDTLLGLAATFQAQGKSSDAIPVYERALVVAAANPTARDRFDPALGELIAACRAQAQWRRLAVYEEQARKRVELEDGAVSPGALKFSCDDLRIQQVAARRFWNDPVGAVVAKPAARANVRPLNIGWLSDDFGDHAGSYQLAAFIEQHDRSKVRLIGYNIGVPIPSDIRFKLRHAFDDFKSFRELSEENAVDIMRKDELDLLVCSIRFGASWRPALLLRRPAPVVVSYQGHPGTLGNACVDYILADGHLIKPGEESLYDEAVVRLPLASRCILPAPPPTAGSGSRSDHGLKDDAFVFCNFSSTDAIGPDTFTAWMQILKDTPKGLLWLGEARHSVRVVLRQEAVARGVDADRLVFGSLTTRDLHLARLAHADLYLDTLTYQDASPVHDALSAGLPVLSQPGNSFSARSGAGLVAAAGIKSLVAPSLAEYTATAVRLGSAPKDALELKHALKAEMSRNPVFNPTQFFTQLQRAFDMIVERSRNGAPASSFDVTG
jgi:predicted O-linked N-acetylglucosamine transferase (SPINDLY family)